ncbi:mammalian cell entry protein [Mycobacteroides franklinii]|uniref:Mammalian cell entry protein n=1 Tax=Mycobacteroides franklinii TaxID=948102 RepID=A0A1S1L812_9MYCO|nr:MlaD family protein [Mycobacteroides franklinii]OHU21263.1 mammalian cell entry protein [Mycobacteroides franklinii]
MRNPFEFEGRGPNPAQLLRRGAVVILAMTVAVALLLMKSTGRLDDYVNVVAELNNVGDGLPKKSDVKYRGVLVGAVNDVTPAVDGKPNYVRIRIKALYAKNIPSTVTARVVPSNVFAVSSVQLVQNGNASGIRSGARIQQDTTLPTVLFQTTISKLRDVLAATGRDRNDNSIGILAAIGAATDNRRVKLLTGGAQLNRLIAQLDSIVTTDPGPSTVSALVDAAAGLQQTAPDLVDALHQAVKPMQTFAEKRAQLASMVTGAIHTFGTAREAIDNHVDQLIQISAELGPALGVIAKNRKHFVPIAIRTKTFANKFIEEAWNPETDTATLRGILSFTPTYTYTRADCPQYGELKGPSCFTAPEIAVRPDLPEVLLPQNYQPPKDLAPPPGTVLGPNGNLVAVGPPLINRNPSLVDPNPPLPWWTGPAPRVPGTADPADAPPPLPSPDPSVPGAAPASYGGNVGPVGGAEERAQLSLLTGEPASAATQLLLGPVARGTTVSLAQPERNRP